MGAPPSMKNIPALFTNASIDPNMLMAASATLAAVVASPMSASTKASFDDEGRSFDLVTLREVATDIVVTVEKSLYSAGTCALRTAGDDHGPCCIDHIQVPY
jgi:hypothetical protein